MNRRAFTFVELAVVLPSLLLVVAAVSTTYLAHVRSLRSSTLQSDLRSEAARVAARVFRLTAVHRGQIQSDQAGIVFSEGPAIRWMGTEVRLGKRPLTEHSVSEFALLRRDGELVVTLEFSVPGSWSRQACRQRFQFSHPERSR